MVRPSGVLRRASARGAAGAAVALLGIGLAGAQPAEPYRLGVGDRIDVVVVGEVELTTTPPGLEVGPDGRVGYPYAGMIVVQGKTCEEVATIIAKALAGRVVIKPEVVVRVNAYNAQKINVIGAVRQPGSFVHRPGTKVRDAVALAGGLATESGLDPSYLRVQVVHANGEALTLGLDDALKGAGPAAGLDLRPGDTLVVEQGANVAVLGFVANPGFIRVQSATRLSDVVAKAGGVPARDEGDLANVVLNRADGKVQKVDLQSALAGKGGENPLVSPGDVVFVPRSQRDANVLGYVAAPGKYPFREGDRVSDLLAQAKGPLISPTGVPRGDVARMVLAHSDGTAATLDLSRVPAAGTLDQADPLLQPGDTLMVPEVQYRVVVSGFVRAPGLYDFRAGDTVGVAVAQAGGLLPNLGSETNVRVKHRDGTEAVADLTHDTTVLQPGDEINVPYARHRVTVIGYVAKPGVYDFQEGDTVVEMLATAGGPLGPRGSANWQTERGDALQVLLLRRENSQDRIYRLDLRAFLRTGDRSANMTVEAGDFIAVPGKHTTDWERILRDLIIVPRLLGSF